MNASPKQPRLVTHQVFNQSPDFSGHNTFSQDPMLARICETLPQVVQAELAELGQWAGSLDAQESAKLANRHGPVLKQFDTKGNRIDLVEFHPAWHELMRRSVGLGMHCSIWQEDRAELGQRHLARAARYYLTAAVEMGHLCPITMTNACVAALGASPEVSKQWLPLILSRLYAPSTAAPQTKLHVLLGMGMTEKQGGTDVRANTTRAQKVDSQWWQITGHKWFMSAPQSEAILVLAQMPEGMGCFLVPSLLPDSSDNGLRFQRLKDKLGNRANASSEVEFHQSLAQLIGQPGKGVQTIIEMVTLTRLDCAISSAGMMRAAVGEAVHHCRHRSVMGKLLIDQPLMRNVLADMSVDLAAATALSFRLAQSFDASQNDSIQAAYARLMTPVIKYWTCKIVPGFVYEAMECLGGNGYVEDGNLARYYREAPLNAIWEGSGNVMCLDILRVLEKNGQALNQVIESLRSDLLGLISESAVTEVRSVIDSANRNPGTARAAAERLAMLAAAAELRRSGWDDVAQALIATRLDGRWRCTYGMLPSQWVNPVLTAVFGTAAGS